MKYLILSIIIMTAALVGCVRDKEPPAAGVTPADPAALIETGWRLETINGIPSPEGVEITLFFDTESSATSRAGAFWLWVSYQANNDVLQFRSKKSRESVQSAELEQYAANYMNMLGEGIHRFIHSGTRLEIVTESGDSLVFSQDNTVPGLSAIQRETGNVTHGAMSVFYPGYSLDDLIERSEVIVIGTVKEAVASRKGPGLREETIFHDIIIGVGRYLTGEKVDNEITLRQLGGTIGNESFFVDNQPFFIKGDRILLFLHQGNAPVILLSGEETSREIYGVTAGLQGYFHADDGDTVYDSQGDEYSLTEIENRIKELRGTP